MDGLKEHRRLAALMLRAGAQVPDVEAMLAARGVDAESARRIVDEALQVSLTAATSPVDRVGQSPSLPKIVAGLLIAIFALVGVFVALSFTGDNMIFGVGAIPGAIRGAIVGGFGGMAVGGLNWVRIELMRWWL